MNIEEVAVKSPDKIITTKVDFNESISEEDCKKIIKIFDLDNDVSKQAINLIKSIYKMFIDTDANLVEINPLILTKKNKIVCLDAKMTFDENALFKHPEIQKLRAQRRRTPTSQKLRNSETQKNRTQKLRN